VKYIVIIVLTALVVGFGVTAYFKGWLPLANVYTPQAVSVQNTEVSDIPQATASPIVSASPSASFATIKAGGVLSFKAYSINVPAGWIYARETAPSAEVAMDKLILTKDNYKITIWQAASGGAPCLYAGDADVEGPSSRFNSFVEIVTQSSDKLRRGWTTEGTGYTICEKTGTNPYGQPTTFGHISIQTPTGGATIPMLTEIDSILSSLKKN
jgi:hypothetical protein